MKSSRTLHYVLFILFTSLAAICHAQIQGISPLWTAEELRSANTTGEASSYMQSSERDIITVLNLARMYPKRFINLELDIDEKDYDYQNKLSLIHHMTSMRPRQPLKPDLTMYKLARCWAKESGESGLVGHNRVQCEKGYMAECCSYGKSTALGIVLQLLIDHGVPSLGHRKICLSDKYSLVGATISTHLTYGSTSVLDFSYSNVRTYSPRRDINTRTWSNNSDIRVKPYNWCFKFGYQMFSNPISTDLFKTNTVNGVFKETSRSMYSNFTFGIYKKFGLKERPKRAVRERYVEAGIKFRDRSWSDLVGLKYEFIAAPPLSFSQNTQERLSFNSRLSIDVMLAKFLNLGVGAAFLTDYTALPQSLFSPSVGMTFPVWRFNLTGHFHYFTNFNQVSLWNFSGGVLYNINFGRSAWK